MNHKAWIAKAAKPPMVLETVDLGPLGSEDVEVAVEHCGLCHSDLSVLNNEGAFRSTPRFSATRTSVGSRPQVRLSRGSRSDGASAAIKQLGGRFDLLVSTVNVKLDWDAMIGTLAPNGRLHVVGAVLEPIPVAAFSLILQQRSVSGSPTGSPVAI